MKVCIACGMPMKKPLDFAKGDLDKNYCVHCARPDGEMQSYEEKLLSLSDFIVRTQGLDPQAARVIAQEMMDKLPAWKKEG